MPEIIANTPGLPIVAYLGREVCRVTTVFLPVCLSVCLFYVYEQRVYSLLYTAPCGTIAKHLVIVGQIKPVMLQGEDEVHSKLSGGPALKAATALCWPQARWLRGRRRSRSSSSSSSAAPCPPARVHEVPLLLVVGASRLRYGVEDVGACAYAGSAKSDGDRSSHLFT